MRFLFLVLFLLVPIEPPAFYHPDSYRIDFIKTIILNDKGEKLAEFYSFTRYERNGEKRLALISKQGFILYNIPLEDARYFNECMEIFLEAEQELPRVKMCLEMHGYQARDIDTVELYYPENRIWSNNAGRVRFTCPNSSSKSGYCFGLNFSGLGTPGAIVTRFCVGHEYIHTSGYHHDDGPYGVCTLSKLIH